MEREIGKVTKKHFDVIGDNPVSFIPYKFNLNKDYLVNIDGTCKPQKVLNVESKKALIKGKNGVIGPKPFFECIDYDGNNPELGTVGPVSGEQETDDDNLETGNNEQEIGDGPETEYVNSETGNDKEEIGDGPKIEGDKTERPDSARTVSSNSSIKSSKKIPVKIPQKKTKEERQRDINSRIAKLKLSIIPITNELSIIGKIDDKDPFKPRQQNLLDKKAGIENDIAILKQQLLKIKGGKRRTKKTKKSKTKSKSKKSKKRRSRRKK